MEYVNFYWRKETWAYSAKVLSQNRYFQQIKYIYAL
jgi:hypothetical protein